MSYIESHVVLMMASFCFTLLLYAEFFLKYDNYLLKNDKNMLTKNNSDDMMVSNGGWKNLTEVCYERER